jgi:hypothetical protein
MLTKSADSVLDFKVIDDDGCRRISIFGMGWTGYTLRHLSAVDVFDNFDENEETKLDMSEMNLLASQVVFNEDLEYMAHYFYNLGRQHGIESVKDEMDKKVN